jgi:ATP-binding cassette subfamily C (CFTR/MRP) protein 1
VNAVERVLWYTDPNSVPQEAAHEIPASDPPKNWPSTGAISMEKIVMSYRPGLPAVLKGISLDIKSGEKVGIIGRTGAGKTSITVALYRLAELTSGTIKIDGVDVSTFGLHTLRSRVAIIPQDPVLFSGTLRSNLDPFDLYTDERLYDAMKRACITDSTVGGEGREVKRFTLDTVVEDEGLNLSECKGKGIGLMRRCG